MGAVSQPPSTRQKALRVRSEKIEGGSRMANDREVATPKAKAQRVHYKLLNIIHHELEGAALCDQFATDEQVRRDSELAEFFDEISEISKRWAERARELLSERRRADPAADFYASRSSAN
jgi:hypothetical protein